MPHGDHVSHIASIVLMWSLTSERIACFSSAKLLIPNWALNIYLLLCLPLDAAMFSLGRTRGLGENPRSYINKGDEAVSEAFGLCNRVF